MAGGGPWRRCGASYSASGGAWSATRSTTTITAMPRPFRRSWTGSRPSSCAALSWRARSPGTAQFRATAAGDAPRWEGMERFVAKLKDTRIQTAIRRLVAEFVALRPQAPAPPSEKGPVETPLFHDQLTAGYKAPGQKDPPKTPGDDDSGDDGDDPKQPPGPWRDRWNNSQPWFPLFLEWEITYFHVPFKHWTLEPRGSLTHRAAQLRYGISGTTNLEEVAGGAKADRRTVQGRVRLLPQPSFSLAAKIDQLFSDTPVTDLKDPTKGGSFPLTKKELRQLQRQLHQLAFLSAPLAGFSAHLTTLLHGTHIKPILRDPLRRVLEPVTDAERPKAAFDRAALAKMGLETDSTPFATGSRT